VVLLGSEEKIIMKESEIISAIKNYLKTVDDCFFYKTHGGTYSQAGIPDILCCLGGRFVALEVKNEKGKTTVLQEVTMRNIRKASGTTEVVRSVDDVKRIIQELR